MIQELFGGAGLIGGEKKFPTILEGTPSPSSSCSSTSTTTPTTAATSSTVENLRCPRCDSTNTKFCYYNNYNLTQPRHFCRTCRRYWTKGGALRNVPIGGGCRKNRSASFSASAGKPSISKMKNLASEIGRSGFANEFGHEVSFSPIIWSAPQDSNILALLRGNQNHNPNPGALSNSFSVKKEGVIIGTHLITEPTSVATGEPNSPTLRQDPLGQVPSLGLSNPFGKNCQNQAQPHQNGFLVDEAQDSGLRELYQRLTFSANYYAGNSPVILGNAASSSTSASSAVLESAPVDGGEGVLGNWNPAFSWSDFQN